MKRLRHLIKNMSTKKKMVFLCGCLITLTILLGIGSSISLSLLNKQTKNVTIKWLPSLGYAEQLNALTSEYRIKQYGHITAEAKEEMDLYETQMEELEKLIDADTAKYQKLVSSDEDTKLLQVAEAAWEEYKTISAEVITYSQDGKKDKARTLMIGGARDKYEEFNASFDQLVEFNNAGANSSVKSADLTYTIMLAVNIAMLVIIVIVAFVLSKVLTDVIVSPLELIRTAMKKLVNEGDLSVHVDYESRDEFGVLAEEVNEFIFELTDIIQDEKVLMEQMAEGNFDVVSAIPEKYIGDFKSVIESMRKIKNKLGTALSNIADNAQQLDQASVQLAQEAQSLSDGAVEQAGIVDKILTTVEEVEEKSISSAKQAKDVNNQAKHAKSEAEISNNHMERMITEMELINNTSNKISTIINAIEDIASQTNMLSLNAAIEAARAGEAGKGFAVVADEIGKLALQCSESAKSTRELIETAIHEAEQGNDIARKTADALKVVTENISTMAELAELVQENCEVQSVLMVEINTGVESISNVVETNSSAAEETTASSEELSATADNLNQQLSEFKFSM